MFFHLMYEGAVDLAALREENESLYRRVLSLVENYGQIPPQLFLEPHPVRHGPNHCDMEYPVLSLMNTECKRCCPMVGLELHPAPFKRRPNMLIPWPMVSPTSAPAALNIHAAPVIFVAKSEKNVRFCCVWHLFVPFSSPAS